MKFGKLQDFYTMQVEEKRQKMKWERRVPFSIEQ